MLIGLLCALGAAVAYGAASILQSVGIKNSGASGGSAGDLMNLRSQPLYFVGLLMDGLGFIGVVVALQYLPLFLVQAVVAASVGVTAVIAVFMGAKLGRSGWSALIAAAVGLVLLSLSAASENGDVLPIGWRWFLLGSVLLVGLLGLAGSRMKGSASAAVLAFGAGLGFSVVAIASRTLEFPHPVWKVLTDPALYAVLAAGGVAITLFAMALQAGSVTTVSAICFTTETVVPAGVGLAWLGDSVRDGFWPVAIVGFVLAVGGAVALAQFSEGVPEAADPEVTARRIAGSAELNEA